MPVFFRCEPFCFVKTDCRNPVCFRQCNIKYLQFRLILPLQQRQHILQESRFHRHDVLKAVYKAHLKIQAGILVQVTLGVVLFCPEHRPRLKHPVKDAYHHLLVKLRALCQHCRMMKIVQPEKVRAAFRPFRSDLRRMNLRKSLTVKEIPEPSYDSFLDSEFCSLPDIAQRYGSHVQLRLQRSVHFPFGNRQRHRRGRLRKYLYTA